jgi:hypothetical protein
MCSRETWRCWSVDGVCSRRVSRRCSMRFRPSRWSRVSWKSQLEVSVVGGVGEERGGEVRAKVSSPQTGEGRRKSKVQGRKSKGENCESLIVYTCDLTKQVILSRKSLFLEFLGSGVWGQEQAGRKIHRPCPQERLAAGAAGERDIVGAVWIPAATLWDEGNSTSLACASD